MNTRNQIRTVQFNNITISYTLVRKNVKNLNLRIHTDKSVYVSAPHFVSSAKIDQFVINKGEFILNAFRKFEKTERIKSKEIEYINGAEIPYLGHKIILCLISSEQPKYELCEDTLKIFTKNINSKEEVEKLVNKFYSEQCRNIFSMIIKKQYQLFEKLGVRYPQLRIKNMKSRWGSCLVQKGIITLNSSLIYVPLSCIEYVVLHEYCHFIHPNHSKDFHALVSSFMPDWKERKKTLNNSVIL
ncbi:MAG: M48 family metallopeptidase [Ruminococcus sp.]|nr:M48 family metallopeptidase [Ruminococcus sp.]